MLYFAYSFEFKTQNLLCMDMNPQTKKPQNSKPVIPDSISFRVFGKCPIVLVLHSYFLLIGLIWDRDADVEMELETCGNLRKWIWILTKRPYQRLLHPISSIFHSISLLIDLEHLGGSEIRNHHIVNRLVTPRWEWNWKPPWTNLKSRALASYPV